MNPLPEFCTRREEIVDICTMGSDDDPDSTFR